MRILVAAGVLATLLGLGAACSGGGNQAGSTKVPSATVAASQVSGGKSVPAGTAANNSQSLVGAGSAAVEERLTRAALQNADVPPELDQTNNRPWSNKDYANGQADAAAYQQKLDSGGRISGIVVQFIAKAATPADAQQMAGMVDLLSTWKSDANASAGLAETLKAVTPQAAQPNAVKTDREMIDLGNIGDEVTATHLHITPLTPGLPQSDAYIVGFRKGKDTGIMILTGQSGAPTVDTVKRLVSLQVQRLN